MLGELCQPVETYETFFHDFNIEGYKMTSWKFLRFFSFKISGKEWATHRIHGTGIFTHMNG